MQIQPGLRSRLKGKVSANPARRAAGNRPSILYLKPEPPFDLEFTVWALRRRPNNLIDRWDGQTYRRVLVFVDQPFEVAVTQEGSNEAPRLRAELSGNAPSPAAKAQVRNVLEKLLGLRVDLGGFYRLAAHDPRLGPLAARFRGVKPPRFPNVFEALANAIACQQLSLTLGILLLSRLTERFGLSSGLAGGDARAFPRPADLACASLGALRELGFSGQKARALLELSKAFLAQTQKWEALQDLDSQTVVEELRQLHGVGRWSAEYVLLRGLGRLDVLPGDDVGARNNLGRLLNLRKPLNYEGVRRLTTGWQPYAGVVYFHMLLDRLAAVGHIRRRVTELAR